MNRLILILLMPLMVASAFGQRVTDNLHLLTAEEASRLESNIGSRPIYIETLDSVPGDLKAYADQKVQSLTVNGKAVLIVVTIHPKAWRISEWPHGLVQVQSLGDQMASQFKRGQFFAGFNGAAQAIDYGVTHPPTTAPTKTVTRTTTQTHTQTHVARPMVYARGYDPFFAFLWIALGLTLLVFVIWLIAEACTSRTVVVHDGPYTVGPVSGASSVPRSTATEYYNQYSPAQRQAIANTYVGQPGYYPGIYRDPMQFYMFLMTMNALTSHPYYGYGYGMGPGGYMGGGGVGGIDQVTDTTTTTTTESVRDDAGAGGGWGSAPSRDSDSAGSGGSWSSPSSDPSPSTDFGSSFGSSDSGGGGSFDSGGSSGGGDSGGGGGW